MKLPYLILFFMGTLLGYSQKDLTFLVDWKQTYEPTINNTIWVGDKIYPQANSIPVYLNKWDKEEVGVIGQVKYYDIVTKELDKELLGGVDFNYLPNNFNPLLKVVTARDDEYYTVRANVMYKNGEGRIIQVQSFKVSYELILGQSNNKNAKIASNSAMNAVRNSVLNSGTWYKIAVDKSGVFKIDADFLNSIGIDTSTLDPRKIRIFGNGGAMLPEQLGEFRREGLSENAIYVFGEDDGKFNDSDYVLFYAQGPISWKIENRSSIYHRQNIYSDYAYYFINIDMGIDGKRISSAPVVNSEKTLSVTSFTDFQLHEKDVFNYIRAGRQWFGENFTIDNQQDFTFNFPNILKTEPVIVKGNFSALSRSIPTSYSVLYKNNKILERPIQPHSFSAFNETKGLGTLSPLDDSLVLSVYWDNKGDLSATARLDYLEVIADRSLVATGSQFKFLNFYSNQTEQVLEYTISNATELDFIWNITDITNPLSVYDIDDSVNSFKFKELTDGNLNTYQLIKISDAYAPIKLSSGANVENQNLHSLKDIQYVILTQKKFFDEAKRIRDYHRENTTISESNLEKIKVEVIDINQVYNEFGSGSPDITAIRDFAKFLYDNSSTSDTKLKYLCLFGDASFDFKGITYDETQIVPTYQSLVSNNLIHSYNTDDYFAYLDPSDDNLTEGDLSLVGQMDIVTGRIPVGTLTKANQYVTKLLNYYSSTSWGAWKTRVSLFGDDGQEGSDQSLIKYLEDSSIILARNNPDLNINKLYTDAFKEEITSGGGAYPGVTKRFKDAFSKGSLVINYFGHGNNYTLGQENFLDISAIRSLRNLNNLPLFITVTCDFSRFDDPTILSGGEELIESELGGAIAMIATSREITIFAGNSINRNLADYLYSFDGKTRTAAEALRDVKNKVRVRNQFFVYFLGDPAMKLSLPKRGIDIDKIEKYSIDPVSQNTFLEQVTELKALSKIKVTGSVAENGSVLTDFDGTLNITLFDKEIDRKTLLNEGSGTVLEFKSLENKVFVGEASVTKGKFSFDFVLSKDLSLTPEKAKFSFYAASDDKERIGSDFNYKVGGIDTEAPEDKTPPVIELFLDDETFVNGGNTTSTPKLLAKIYDDSGVNTSFNSIGHDITVVIDGDYANPISVNEFYTTEKDDFTTGLISYEIEELSVGNHTLTLKAWDTYNNSSTQSLSFYVREDKGFEISKVLNYPNPFINHTEFWFKNNRLGDPIEITVQIYTVSGKLLKTIHRSDSNLDEISRVVTWDGKDDYGNRLGKGVYIYKLTVKENITGQSNEKIEKLVIL
ncbi:type IX secretion system sortase PorU [Wenyingzhuangia sp.]|uniref:type IX secretion system sortase PorU n=1 Tax=Wenyingzhuangia sp. TaxID=1964193 RepID=UPI003219F6FF